jgi:Cu/Ag efflux protein CusF
VIVARPSPTTILVRHDAIVALGMSAMELMAVVGDARTIDAARVAPGDTVRLAVRRDGDDVTLLRIEKLR